MKLLGIDASGIADGLPAVVLNLIWNMILFFQAGVFFIPSSIILMCSCFISHLTWVFVVVTDLTYTPLFHSNNAGKGGDGRPPEAFVF